MKKLIWIASIVILATACNNAKKEEAEKPAEATVAPATETSTPAMAMPYTATYSSNFTQDISDAHLKVVLDSYKFWETGDFKALAPIMGDSIFFSNNEGIEKTYANADLMKMWKSHRDSLSSVKITMTAWNKMKSDKGHEIVASWYDEVDTYKTGKADSASWHDLNIVDSTGRIVWYAQYKKPKLK